MAHGAKKPLSYEEQMEIALALSAKEAKEKAKVCLIDIKFTTAILTLRFTVLLRSG